MITWASNYLITCTVLFPHTCFFGSARIMSHRRKSLISLTLENFWQQSLNDHTKFQLPRMWHLMSSDTPDITYLPGTLSSWLQACLSLRLYGTLAANPGQLWWLSLCNLCLDSRHKCGQCAGYDDYADFSLFQTSKSCSDVNRTPHPTRKQHWLIKSKVVRETQQQWSPIAGLLKFYLNSQMQHLEIFKFSKDRLQAMAAFL